MIAEMASSDAPASIGVDCATTTTRGHVMRKRTPLAIFLAVLFAPGLALAQTTPVVRLQNLGARRHESGQDVAVLSRRARLHRERQRRPALASTAEARRAQLQLYEHQRHELPRGHVPHSKRRVRLRAHGVHGRQTPRRRAEHPRRRAPRCSRCACAICRKRCRKPWPRAPRWSPRAGSRSTTRSSSATRTASSSRSCNPTRFRATSPATSSVRRSALR